MRDVVVADGGLAALALTAKRLADAVGRTRVALGRPAGDLGEVTQAHELLVDRWVRGLVVATGAVDELAEKIGACDAQYQAQEDGVAVVFAGLDR